MKLAAQLNDNGDIVFRIKPDKGFLNKNAPRLNNDELIDMFEDTEKEENDDEREPIRNCSFFYFTPGPK